MDPFGASNADLETIITEHTQTFHQIRQAAREHAALSHQLDGTEVVDQRGGSLTHKEAEKKRSHTKKDKGKARSGKGKMSYPLATEFPGAVPGLEINASANWQAADLYFRDVTAEDILRLCPAYDDPHEDPVFHIPFLGAPFESEEEQQAKIKQQANQIMRPRSRARATLNDMGDLGVMDPLDFLGDKDKRKSSRLGAKAAGRLDDVPPLAGTPGRTGLLTPQSAGFQSGLGGHIAQQIEARPLMTHTLSAEQAAFLDDWATRGSQVGASDHSDTAANADGDALGMTTAQDPTGASALDMSEDSRFHFARMALYTKEMLKRPPTAFVEMADTVAGRPGRDLPPVAGIEAMSAPHLDSPQASDMSMGIPTATVDTASNQARAPGLSEAVTAGLKSSSGPAQPFPGLTVSVDLPVNPNVKDLITPSPRGPSGSMPKASRPGKSRFASGPSKGGGATQGAAGRPAMKSGGQLDPSRNAVTAALAAHVAAGPNDMDLAAQWKQLDESADILAMAPDDEILAEIYALQSELIQQMAINRRRAASMLVQVVKDLPRQRAAAKVRADGTQVAKNWILKQRAAKRVVKREKREAAQREAQKASEAVMQSSPRKVQGRLRGALVDGGPAPLAVTPPPPPPEVPMEDLLAERRKEDEALCAVCGEGDSPPGNEIIFCERCDVAVHQNCYSVNTIPEGEWLCWPCLKFEQAELASGKTQNEIRPPRVEGNSSAQAKALRTLPGGGRTVPCILCPVRRGAFRQTTDGKHWLHQVCAQWHPEPRILNEPVSEAVDGINEIKPDRWHVECSICRRSEGAVIRCNAGHCAAAFHPLCARNTGLHLVTRDARTSKEAHRAYCAIHSEAQRAKDQSSEAEGVVAFLRNQARIKQHLEKVNAAAVSAHKAQVEERRVLQRVRLELEDLRILLQRINKREKLKRDYVKALVEEVQTTVQDNSSRSQPDSLENADHAEVNGRGVKRKGTPAEDDSQEGREIEREVKMTPDEAAQTNGKLPKGFMYVSKDDLTVDPVEASSSFVEAQS